MQDFLTRYKRAGFSFFNTGTFEKKCKTKWKIYSERKPTEEEFKSWLKWPSQNYAIVCGEISNLVVFDVDTKNGGDPTPFLNRGLYEIRTPSGGYHFYTPYDPLFKSTKHKKEDGILKAVDVQSNNALVFAPPSKFANGKYILVHDASIIPLPDDLFIKVLNALEPEKESKQYTPYIAPANVDGGRPGDIFNALASWEDVLYPLGWTKVGHENSNGVQYWRRPGKKDGISASTNWNGHNLFFPYTTFFSELDPKRGYTKFRLLALMKYGGDYKKAARDLVVGNYKRVSDLI